MTGMNFSWKVENASVIWRTNISEFGRSIQTPKLGEIFKPGEDSVDHFYSASLTGPGGFQRAHNNTTLVVEVKLDIKQGDDLTWTSNYKLYGPGKNLVDADAHCKSQGGQLASIHSEQDHARAVEAAEGNSVLLGGRREKVLGWRWSDNSTWDFTNWDSYSAPVHIGSFARQILQSQR